MLRFNIRENYDTTSLHCNTYTSEKADTQQWSLNECTIVHPWSMCTLHTKWKMRWLELKAIHRSKPHPSSKLYILLVLQKLHSFWQAMIFFCNLRLRYCPQWLHKNFSQAQQKPLYYFPWWHEFIFQTCFFSTNKNTPVQMILRFLFIFSKGI